MGIVIKDRAQIARMRGTGQVVAAVLDAVEAACVPGATTADHYEALLPWRLMPAAAT